MSDRVDPAGTKNLAAFRDRLATVPWSRRHGAYGPSDGSVVRHDLVLGDVPGALVRLATVRNADSDGWADAMEVLWSHVLHQGDLHPVTSDVVPFLFDLLELEDASPQRPSEIALVLAHAAASARDWMASDEPLRQQIGAWVADAIATHTASLQAWSARRLGEYAVFIATRIDAVREPIFEALSHRKEWPVYAFVACAELVAPGADAIRRAERALDSANPLVVLAAAALLAKRGNPDVALARRIEAALPPDAAARLQRAVSAPFSIEVVRPRVPFDGPLVPATVLFVGPALVVVNYAAGKNAQIRWADSPLSKGAAVRIGLSPHGEVRVVEYARDDGGVERFESK